MPQSPHVADAAPDEPFLTGYDEQHLVTYLRLLDADAEGADWREVAEVVLKIDPSKESQRAKRVWESHLARKRSTHRELERIRRVPPPELSRV